ncbi:MAG: nicotinate-nucleotide adenylyltransferase [Pseudomonadota bacterium]|jgi:nicotinate-nucleotide adenylyltransferase|nr:nicotinate-nucleotide adenylyltransferase [Pseudomonadota bacterium]MDQ5880264.1 nicotinate-nucleotide adenylyltransferase [Pseudomonadota bacterium]MDQ5903606.1 nicotinate-nucleotide adenylyltransferase [Pseudomonadota bacterium]MDQ5914986.1 nicotinate-nucleotide adenylyltransferase [Pseudomonadota bacterium]MDQ5947005.1 nicotinate-nucleotide adenylyltransferase [Pseudomonadota bacterium]
MRDPLPLGIFGGTFDPVHVGHLRLAEEASETLGLSGVRWIPAGQPKHREAPQVTPAHRLQMVRLATAGNPLFSVDPAEVESGEASFTVPTLERLREKFGQRQPLILLLGADAYAGLNTWHRWQEIFSFAHLAVAHRPGYPVNADTLPAPLAEEHRQRYAPEPATLAAAGAGIITTFAMTPLTISATHIRQILAQGQSPRYLLTQPVIDYIDLHHLYRNNDGS